MSHLNMRKRGSGKTTAVLKSAPQDSVFVWCNSDLSYPKELCKKLGRDDIKVVGPSWLRKDCRGQIVSALIRDHAWREHWGTEEIWNWAIAVNRVRS